MTLPSYQPLWLTTLPLLSDQLIWLVSSPYSQINQYGSCGFPYSNPTAQTFHYVARPYCPLLSDGTAMSVTDSPNTWKNRPWFRIRSLDALLVRLTFTGCIVDQPACLSILKMEFLRLSTMSSWTHHTQPTFGSTSHEDSQADDTYPTLTSTTYGSRVYHTYPKIALTNKCSTVHNTYPTLVSTTIAHELTILALLSDQPRNGSPYLPYSWIGKLCSHVAQCLPYNWIDNQLFTALTRLTLLSDPPRMAHRNTMAYPYSRTDHSCSRAEDTYPTLRSTTMAHGLIVLALALRSTTMADHTYPTLGLTTHVQPAHNTYRTLGSTTMVISRGWRTMTYTTLRSITMAHHTYHTLGSTAFALNGLTIVPAISSQLVVTRSGWPPIKYTNTFVLPSNANIRDNDSPDGVLKDMILIC